MLNYYKIVFRVIKESLQINIGPHNAPKTFSSVTSLLLHSITPLILVQINLADKCAKVTLLYADLWVAIPIESY